MTRPMYESQLDREAEAAVARELAERWNCTALKMKPSYVVDFAMLRHNKCEAFVEIKCRNYTMERMDSMGGFMLSLDKWRAGIDLARSSGALFVVVVDTPDSTWWHKVGTSPEHDGLSFRGRTDRGDPQDVEPVVLLKSWRFKRL